MSAAAAKSKSRNNSGNSRQPPDLPLRDRVAAQLQSMAAEVRCAELAEGAADPEIAGDTVYRLMAHQLAAGHALTMSLGAHAGRLVREAQAGANDDDGGRRSQEMLRFVAGTARLMERCRSAALALDRIGFPEAPGTSPDGPDQGEPMQAGTIKGFPRQVIASRDRERRRLLHWLAEGKKLRELPDVEDWPEYHNPDLPDLERLDERLSPSPPRSSAINAAGLHAAPGLKRGRLKNGNPVGDYMTAPRCGATTRAGRPCRQPAMPNGRCRFHGGRSTGPRTAAGLQRSRTTRLSHGFRTAEIINLRRAAAHMGRNLKVLTRVVRSTRTQDPPQRTQRSQSERDFGASAPSPASNGSSARPSAAPDVIPIKMQGVDRHAAPSSVNSVPSVVNLLSRGPAGHGVDRSELPRRSSSAGQRQGRRA